ncbi:holin family protein [Actibacterium sp. 188UL27-1]|uniref:holin family protein n=1 Tax=Actibacterium sp. 188UL27-1 TaxID=2786961 RepID=UPI00195866F3|nr:holin family protein [Actibacterium sp. 188UL27-1]MBM7067663.1 holin family protein [Actibacterium sp. 188UL27-1]
MGLIDGVLGFLFGSGRNVIRETAEVFRPNAEAEAVRSLAQNGAALDQFAAEFAVPRKGLFDRMIDGLNRLPRPALAIGTLGLFVSAMVDPIWFAERMQGIALVPEPLWWLMGAIVSFYFGARHQAKGQEFQRSIAATMGQTKVVTENLRTLKALEGGQDVVDQPMDGTGNTSDNPALRDWRHGHG